MGPCRVIIFATFLFASTMAGPTRFYKEREVVSKDSDTGYRLPRNVIPSEYELKLTPYLENSDPNKAFTFDGEVNIKVMTKEEGIKEIVLHARDLELEKPSISPESPSIEPLTYNSTYDFVFLKLDRVLANNKEYTISFKFKGKIRTDMAGFYRSWYKQGNETKWLATTQFEQIHARKVFPCFDEPGLKAIFKLTIICPTNLNCQSNMKEKSSDGNTKVYYDSPRMPTYLLAFLVSEFESDASSVEELFKVWARPEAKGQAKYALANGVNVVKQLGDYTGISYYNMHNDSANIKMKMDQVAVPDFSAGAMENWGLITYREGSLMIEEGVSTTKSKRGVLSILAHEIAHMWFGDLVTCDWWSETWLNEGFATFFANYISNKVVDGFHYAEQFVTDEVHASLAEDRSLNSLPLTNPSVNNPTEVGNSFGTITYKKGASVIRMMEHWVGAETFQKGLRYYLTNMTYQAAVPDDLFRNIQKAADEDQSIEGYGYDVKTLFKGWSEKSGHPVLHVSVDHNDKVLVIKQKRYLEKEDDTNKDIYMIPITYATSKNANFSHTKPSFIMNNETMKLDVGVHDNWVIFNVQQTGFYRVMYDDEMYGYIIKALMKDENREAVHINNRAQLINDAYTFAVDDKMKLSKMLDVMQFLENELDYTPWTAAFSAINQLRRSFWTFEELSESFDMHISKLMEKLVGSVGFDIDEKDDEQRRILRTETLKLACNMGHETCVNKSVEWLKMWTEDKSFVIPPDHREFVYCSGVRHGEPSYFTELWKKYLSENVINEKNLILSTLGCTMDADNIAVYLSNGFDLENKTIRDQDRSSIFNYALQGNKDNVDHVFNFFVHHIDSYRSVYGNSTFKSLMRTMTNYMSNSTLALYKDFLENNNGTLAEDEVKSGLDAVKNGEMALEWVQNNEKEVTNWIQAKYNSAGALGASMVLLFVTTFFVFLFQ